MPTIEGIRLNIRRLLIRLLKKRRKRMLKNEQFTIISNNCWGGAVYESLDLIKQSPTVGLLFFAEEYISFLKQFPDILYEDIHFIDPRDSKYATILEKDSRFGAYPIGVLGNVEIEFLHYHNENEVIDKWKRRIKRINFDRLIFKMNDQNLCEKTHLEEFSSLPFNNKIIFSVRDYNLHEIIHFKDNGKHCITASEEPIIFHAKFDIIRYLNEI